MNFEDLKFSYILSCVILSFFILLPTLTIFTVFPRRESFSELWILGTNHTTENYPFDVSVGQTYTVHLEINNRLGGLGYYVVHIKFRNQTEPAPDAVNMMPSIMNPILEYRVFLDDDGKWEKEVSFSFENVSFEGNLSKVSRILIDEYAIDIDKVAVWDEENSGFYYQMFFELWIYNITLSDFQFHNRFVGFWLNITREL